MDENDAQLGMTAPAATRTAFIAALPGEVRALARLGPLGSTRRADGSLVVLGGMGPARAAVAAREAVEQGACALVSWGVAAALAPGFMPGDLVLVDTVIAADGTRLAVDPQWRAWLCARLPRSIRLADSPLADSPAAETTLAETPVVLVDAHDKAALHATTGAAACDMESAAIARVAAETGAAFLAVRAVLDDANMALPLAARAAMDDAGRLRPLALTHALVGRPRGLHAELRGLKHLAVAFRAARATLAGVADVISADATQQ